MASDRLEDLVDTSGGTPSLRVKRFVATILGILSLGWISGVIDTILQWGGGINSSIRSFSSFVRFDLEGALTGAISGAMQAWAQNTAFLTSTFGPLAPLVAVIEVVVVLYLLGLGIRALIRGIFGGGG